MQMTEKVCFVICPIGEPASEERKRADDLFDYVIEPVVNAHGYRAERADKLNQAGIITTQIVQHLVEDDLVIADLTGRNPNVFYELAIRHVTKKPVIPIIVSSEEIPFDVKPVRTLTIDHRDVRSVHAGKETLGKYLESLSDDDSSSHNPVSVAAASLGIRGSDDPSKEVLTQILTMLSNIQSSLPPRPATVIAANPVTATVKKYLSLEEAARWLGLPPDELVRLRERGDVRGFADRGTWKFRLEDVEEYVRRRDSQQT
jgi:excisionase family DNA binding protein